MIKKVSYWTIVFKRMKLASVVFFHFSIIIFLCVDFHAVTEASFRIGSYKDVLR